MKAFARKAEGAESEKTSSKPGSTTMIIESNFVESRVRFTRCLYAQLYNQQFNPAPLFPSVPPPSHPDHFAMSLGIKLAVGIQILYNRLKFKYAEQKQGKSTSQWELNFIQTIEDETRFSSESSTSSWPRVTVPDDDDKWMFVEPQFIDQLLAEHAQPHMRDNATMSPLNPEAEKTLDDLVKNVKQFVHKKSGYEGAEVRRDEEGNDSDFDISDEDSDNSDSEGSDNEEMDVQFSPDKFLNMLQQVLQPPTSDQHHIPPAAGQQRTPPIQPPKGEPTTMGMKSLMAAMDEELAETTVRDTFVDQQQRQHDNGEMNTNGEETLDLDFDVVKHLLESVSQEHGMPGPASTLLNELYKSSRNK